MNEVRKEIIELIEPYMDKTLSEGCLIKDLKNICTQDEYLSSVDEYKDDFNNSFICYYMEDKINDKKDAYGFYSYFLAETFKQIKDNNIKKGQEINYKEIYSKTLEELNKTTLSDIVKKRGEQLIKSIKLSEKEQVIEIERFKKLIKTIHRVPYWMSYETEKKINIYKIKEDKEDKEIAIAHFNLDDMVKIIGHYDITAVEKYIFNNKAYTEIDYNLIQLYYNYGSNKGGDNFGEIPHKPLHLYTEQEEKELLELLKKIK